MMGLVFEGRGMLPRAQLGAWFGGFLLLGRALCMLLRLKL